MTAIGAAFGAIENFTENLAFEISPLGVRVVCLRTLANTDSRSIQDTMEFLGTQLPITKDQAIDEHRCVGGILDGRSDLQKAGLRNLRGFRPGAHADGTVVNATAGAALD